MVGLALLSSVAVLPAQLAALGDRVEGARTPWLGRRRTAPGRSRLRGRAARTAVRRPVPTGATSAVALLVMAPPAPGIRLQGAAATTSLPPGAATVVDAATRMEQELPPAAAEPGDGAAA
ncbi:hypothetical protein [Streptomyces sp. Ncost-T10-10d]|uniref:hypothetical protein n=1 Tax=Streptomyces sp. Ncost-T10-10d TaxID=1839774 RepID=UPI000B845D4D|nr:hypothetical protein [Streptomyces sp. Ncost-T10-10d]